SPVWYGALVGHDPSNVMPVGPVGPVGPVPPSAPVEPLVPSVPDGPVGPVGPVPPVAPVAPVAPGSPLLPLAPDAPVGPRAPVAPALPLVPAGPVGPVAPAVPSVPVAPVGPVGPVGPVAPLPPPLPVSTTCRTAAWPVPVSSLLARRKLTGCTPFSTTPWLLVSLWVTQSGTRLVKATVTKVFFTVTTPEASTTALSVGAVFHVIPFSVQALVTSWTSNWPPVDTDLMKMVRDAACTVCALHGDG